MVRFHVRHAHPLSELYRGLLPFGWKRKANFEYLNQKLTEVERLLPHYRYQFATPEEQSGARIVSSKAQDLVKAAQTAEQAQVVRRWLI